jgi:hypothetical protein
VEDFEKMVSPVDWVDLLCVLGGGRGRGKFGRISDDWLAPESYTDSPKKISAFI